MSRDRRGRFTAERTTTVVTTATTTEEVTERLIVEPPPSPVPVLASDPAPVFGHLLHHPPEGARWAHPDFIADLAARAAAQAQAGFVVPFDETAPVPVIRVEVPVPRTYPELEALDADFTELDQAQLRYALHHDGS